MKKLGLIVAAIGFVAATSFAQTTPPKAKATTHKDATKKEAAHHSAKKGTMHKTAKKGTAHHSAKKGTMHKTAKKGAVHHHTAAKKAATKTAK